MSVSLVEPAEYSAEIKKGAHRIKHILAVTLSLSVWCNKISKPENVFNGPQYHYIRGVSGK